ncbi:hypothetical protein [Paraburkholderia hospita]|uniref:hypothetical protein n=1 Tax=Paraburkholderia hospita TaxID=169430 RepID=UPI000B34157E|nr:hypothetical protein [Paraburkholderia hospita]OUL90112.1 hypothetical protein CA603_17805 [Paraburkholderia hospita]
MSLEFLADVLLYHLAQGHEIGQRRLLRDMLPQVCLVESFEACIAQRSSPVVVLSINGMVNVLEAVVQFLRVPEIHRNNRSGHGIATTEHDVPNFVGRRLVVGLNMIDEDTIEPEPIGLWKSLDEVPVEILARVGLALLLPQLNQLVIARRAGVDLLNHATEGRTPDIEVLVLAIE